MTMMTKKAIKIAVAQVEGMDTGAIFERIIIKDVDWYIFDKTADIVFELERLKEHYDQVFFCEFKEVKVVK